MRSLMGVCAAALAILTPAYGQVSVGSWQIHDGGGPIAFPTPDLAARKAALDKATIPPVNDEKWTVSPDVVVNVEVPSAIKDAYQQVDYMFFQVIVKVPKGTKIDTFKVSFDEVDDAARVMIFNSQNPNGKFYADADVIGKANNLTVKSDFKDDVVEGENRIVITQYDWAPRFNNIKGIRILVNGKEMKPANAMDIPKGGDAKQSTVDPGEYTLTEDRQEQHGGVWAKQPISFKNSFTISAEIFLGNKADSSGADGIALVFQDKGVVSVPSGGGIGYKDMTPSIAIEFDTYQNEDLNDPAKNHVALCMNGDAKHAQDAVTKGDVKEIDYNLEDGKYHPITFEWDAVKKTFNLTLDGKPVFKDKTIPAHAMADNTIRYGFTAATGGRSNEHKVRAISYTKR